MAKHIETVEQVFDLRPFSTAAQCEGVSYVAFAMLQTQMILWNMLDQFPSVADLKAAIHKGYCDAATMAQEMTEEPSDVTVPSIETCEQYARGVLKFAKANEWPRGTVRAYSAFQKQSVSEGKRSGKGRPKGSKNAEKPEAKPEAKPVPVKTECWKDLAVAFSVGVNKTMTLPVKPDDKTTLRSDDASAVQEHLRAIVAILATYY